MLVKSCVDCLAIVLNPNNGDIQAYPLVRNENSENYEGYNDFKTIFSHIETVKRNFLTIFIENNIYDILPVLYELDNDLAMKVSILKILLQLFRYSPKDMIVYFKSNSPFVSLINNIFENDEADNKSIYQLGLLLLIEIVRYLNLSKM
jgi:hypothetical protein